MSPFSLTKLALKRLGEQRFLHASIFVGIVLAITLVVAAPIYLRALERLALNLEIDDLDRTQTNINAIAYNIPLTNETLLETDIQMDAAIERHLSPILEAQERYLIVDTYLAGIPTNPLPESSGPFGLASRAYLRNLTNLEQHVGVVEGRLAGSDVSTEPQGPRIEAVISPATADVFELNVDDTIVLAANIANSTRVLVDIVGFVEATDPNEAYWTPNAGTYLNPREPEGALIEDPTVFNPDRPPVPLFVNRDALVEAITSAYDITLIDSLWFIRVKDDGLKKLSVQDFNQRLSKFENEVADLMPGSEAFTGISRVFAAFERRSFFAKVPLILLLALTVATVLFYLFMMASHLAQSRRGDIALLKTRGVGILQFLRIYALEGLTMVALAVLLSPFLAVGLVAFAGKLPYFREMTDGGLLPVELGALPFLLSFGAGVLSLLLFVAPGLIGARGGVLLLKLQAARPPTVPFFHRYYIDVGLLVLGGLVFWELHQRGQIVSGGLFEDVDINETSLLSPIFFLVVVALVFMRVFPMLVRFISGESPTLLHVAAAGAVLFLAPAILIRETTDGNSTAWLLPSTVALLVGAAYWITRWSPMVTLTVLGLVVQIALVLAFLALEPLDAREVLFAPTLLLIALVPAQAAFGLLRFSTRVMPVWLLMGLWYMARNPFQYTWLVLLLVLVTGLGVLSTTAGGTLDRSNQDRVKYDVAADFRVSNIRFRLPGGPDSLRDGYLGISGVDTASAAIREVGFVGNTSFELLGLESKQFPYMTWYRDDFSTRSLGAVMQSLEPPAELEKVAIPTGATSIGLAVRPTAPYPDVSLWLVIGDGGGSMTTVSLGSLESEGWQTMTARVPPNLPPPLSLASVQIFEPGQGAVGTPGSLLLDDIFVTAGLLDERLVLDDFEEDDGWRRIETSPLSSDRIAIAVDESGSNSVGLFTFGKETVRGVRGFYKSPTGRGISVVVNEAFLAATNTRVGNSFLIDVDGVKVPVIIADSVNHFPTMNAIPGRFMLSDFQGLTSHLNMVSFDREFSADELFINQAPEAHEAVRDGLKSVIGLTGRLHDQAAELEAAQTDPLTTAGWESLVAISLGVVLLAAGLGYVTYLLAFSDRSRGEMGILQSLGFSRRQLMGLLGFEHLTMAVAGLGLGTWAGFQMSDLMVSSVAVTEKGEEVFPPFVLITDWALMLPTYAALAGIFIAALLVLDHSIRRLDLATIARMEGQ